MTCPAPTHLSTNGLFRLDERTIFSTVPCSDYIKLWLTRAVSGGAGAVGTTVGKAILESGADDVFSDIAPSPNEDTWSISKEVLFEKIVLKYSRSYTKRRHREWDQGLVP